MAESGLRIARVVGSPAPGRFPGNRLQISPFIGFPLDFSTVGLTWIRTNEGTPMKTPQELRTASPGQAAKFFDDPNHQYEPIHLQAALANALRQIELLKRDVAELRQRVSDPVNL